MNKFIITYIIRPLAGQWLKGILLLLLWTLSFIALPAISGWFLAMCSVAFITANTMFAYIIPSAIIRLLSIVRTVTRYFERLENHKTTLEAQQRLQLSIFRSVARLPYFRKQVNNNSTLLENSTHGVDQVLNHILLWLLPFTALILCTLIYFAYMAVFSQVIAVQFLLSSAILLFLVPQFFFLQNRKLYLALKDCREENSQALIQSFRGRIEISKYNLGEKAIAQYRQRQSRLELLEKKLQTNSYNLQLVAGLGFSYLATFLLWNSGNYAIDGPMAIGIFFGIIAQAELSEILFSGKSEKSAVAGQIRDIDAILNQGGQPELASEVHSPLRRLEVSAWRAGIPETSLQMPEVTFHVQKGEWIALYGETGKGKTTLLNSLFYPEYRRNGTMIWNSDTRLDRLPVPACIYVTQKACLLTGTLRENFEGYPDGSIEQALATVDLTGWRDALPDGLSTWIGENGETLSGGQRKKLLLAQALLKNPQLLVVDEPTAGISSENAIAIFRNIRLEYPGITILMATHQRGFEAVADRVIWI